MSEIIDEYLEGIKKVPKGKKITPSSVCKAIGKDPASLKRDRIKKYPYLQIIFDAIDKAEEERNKTSQKNIEPIAYEKRLKEKYKDERDEFKRLLNEAYAREVVLIQRIDELERALEVYYTYGQLRLAKPRK